MAQSETRKSPAKRLIDVEKNCIVDGSNVDEYFTLSYVWGMAAQFMLTKDVVNDSKTEGFFSSISTKIPQSIRDAMQVCRNIGVRYLWVDALCIVQNDEQDKNDQIGLMDEIYGQALAVLIVAAGDGAEHGIPGMGQRTRALINCEEAVNGKILMTSLASTTNSAKQSHWNTRAWTYQEYILGNRLLVFTETYVFFRCAKTIFRDGEVLSATEEPTPVPAQSSDDWISVTANDIPEDMDPKEVWKQYYDGLLTFYLRRNMKFDTDSLAAFSGVLKVLSKRLGPFHHGLPKKYFGRSLLWNDAHHGIFEKRKCFPSWSWAGWKWNFDFFDSEKGTVGAYGYEMPKESVPMKFFIFDNEGKLQLFFHEGPEVTEEVPKTRQQTNELMDWFMMANQQVQAYPDLPPEELTMKLLGNMMRKQALGQTQPTKESDEQEKECIARLMAQLEAPEDYQEVNCKSQLRQHTCPGHLVAFYTSVASLKVPLLASQKAEQGSTLDYDVHGRDGQRLFSCFIDPAWRSNQPEHLEFVVIGVKEGGKGVALLLLEEIDGIHYRVNWNWKLSQHLEIKDWMAQGPVQKLIIWVDHVD
ncbi:hypothetical protein CJF31_00009146 [Rutstroemia sp. NJR-2017a BVV2]|nr:hypothetical protein CJF31_00009146 [Rutstroemia sp. NJR-2017a BVV2]